MAATGLGSPHSGLAYEVGSRMSAKWIYNTRARDAALRFVPFCLLSLRERIEVRVRPRFAGKYLGARL